MSESSGETSTVTEQSFVLPSEISKSQTKGQLIDEIVDKAKSQGMDVFNGKGLLTLDQMRTLYGENQYQKIRELYGRQISRGTTANVFWDEESGTITKLFEQNLDNKQITANARQMQIYREGAGKHPFLTFIREVPGGWEQKYFPNDGNLREYLNSGGVLTDQMVQQAIEDVAQLAQITGQAHGDLIKSLDFLNSWQKELLRKNLETLEYTGFINHEQVLVGKRDENGNRRLVFIDWAGGGDPFPVRGTTDPTSPRFVEGEIEGLKKGLDLVKKRQAEVYLKRA